MIRVAIVERSKDRRETIRAALSGFGFEDLQVREFANEYDFRESLDAECTSFDVLLINTTISKEGDGVSLASYVRGKNQMLMICFITESEQYYRDAFLVFATGYVLYPLDTSALYNVFSFHFKKRVRERRATWMIKETGGHYKRIFCRNIVYIESNNREVTVHMEDGSSINSYAKLNNVQTELPAGQFLRCHQSYIVNLYFVEAMEREAFYLNGESIPISRKYQAGSKEAYYDYMFKKV